MSPAIIKLLETYYPDKYGKNDDSANLDGQVGDFTYTEFEKDDE